MEGCEGNRLTPEQRAELWRRDAEMDAVQTTPLTWEQIRERVERPAGADVTGLYDSIEQHDPTRLARLLAGGADPNAPHPNQSPWRPLATAIEELAEGGPIESVVLLIRHGATVDAVDPMREAIPLLIASLNCQPEATRLLLAAGANPDVKDDEGTSPLWTSVEKGDHETAAQLLDSGAGKTLYYSEPFSGMNALGRAAWKLDARMVQLLLGAGVDPKAIDLDRETALERMPPRESSDHHLWDAVAKLLS